MNKLSVVILNFNRPDFIQNDILPSFNNKYIDEVIISHGKEETYKDFTSKNFTVKNLKHYNEINKEYGLARRFLSALESKNNNLIIMDDDIIPSEYAIKFLNDKIIEDNQRIYGIYGRSIDDKNEYSYTNYFGTTPIVLTRCLITTKEMCQYFIDNFRKYENEEIKNSKPYWNGEDILFSLLSIQKYDKLPKSYDLKHTNRVSNYINFNESISGEDTHMNYRKNLTKHLIDKMKLKDKIKEKIKLKHWKTQVSYFVENSFLIYVVYIIAFLIFFFDVYYYILRV